MNMEAHKLVCDCQHHAPFVVVAEKVTDDVPITDKGEVAEVLVALSDSSGTCPSTPVAVIEHDTN